MKETTLHHDRLGASRWRIAAWGAAAVILLAPLVAMQFTDEVAWDLADFVVFGGLLLVAGAGCEFAIRKTNNGPYRFAAGIAIATAFILIWVNLAVGIIGNEGDSANLLFFGVLVVGIVGASAARFEPRGMARAMVATALAQVLVAVTAVTAGWGSSDPNWPMDILVATLILTTLWVIAAALFQNAAARVAFETSDTGNNEQEASDK